MVTPIVTPIVTIEAFGGTHSGRVRPANEDCFLIGNLDTGERWAADEPLRHIAADHGVLLVVCDGMGGAAAGEVASKMAVDTLWAEMQDTPATTDRVVFARLLRRAVRVANRRIWEESKRTPQYRGMGTTMSAAGLVGDALILAQVGDSRAYLARGDSLVQVTRDQSMVSALMQKGDITLAQARVLPQANVILQALGVRKDVEVALSIVELRRGDRVLICSDGLHGPVADHDLVSLLGMRHEAAAAVKLLIDAACAVGGPDNITAVLARMGGDGLAPPVGPEDLPRFIEIDPMEDGPAALTSTSRVARRLAARAGIGQDPGPTVVPATGQHPVIRGRDDSSPEAAADAETSRLFDATLAGPADAALATRSRLGRAAWIAAGILLLTALGLALLDVW